MQNLNEKAMLVKNSISCWTGKRVDKKISKETSERYGASDKAGKYTKYLVDVDSLKPVKKAASEIKTYYYKVTLPWSDNGGGRLLPAKMYLDFTAKMRELKTAFEKAVNDFISEYENLVWKAKVDLKGMFNQNDYPSSEEIALKFGVKNHIRPIPAGSDFRVSLNENEIQAIRADIELRNKTALETATRDLWHRLYEVVEKIGSKMKEDGPRFRDSLVGNVVDLCRLLPKLNLTDDSNLTRMTHEIERSLTLSTPKELRESPEARQDIAKEADGILKRMEGYI